MMIDYLRELNLASVFLRLTLAMFFGGMIGIEREKKRRPAGFRTYMLVCLALRWRASSASTIMS